MHRKLNIQAQQTYGTKQNNLLPPSPPKGLKSCHTNGAVNTAWLLSLHYQDIGEEETKSYQSYPICLPTGISFFPNVVP